MPKSNKVAKKPKNSREPQGSLERSRQKKLNVCTEIDFTFLLNSMEEKQRRATEKRRIAEEKELHIIQANKSMLFDKFKIDIWKDIREEIRLKKNRNYNALNNLEKLLPEDKGLQDSVLEYKQDLNKLSSIIKDAKIEVLQSYHLLLDEQLAIIMNLDDRIKNPDLTYHYGDDFITPVIR